MRADTVSSELFQFSAWYLPPKKKEKRTSHCLHGAVINAMELPTLQVSPDNNQTLMKTSETLPRPLGSAHTVSYPITKY